MKSEFYPSQNTINVFYVQSCTNCLERRSEKISTNIKYNISLFHFLLLFLFISFVRYNKIKVMSNLNEIKLFGINKKKS